MSKSDDKIRQAELIKECLNKNNFNDGRDMYKKLECMRVNSKGRDKVLLNMLLSDKR